MDWKAHAAIAAACCFLLDAALGWPITAAIVAATILGALSPDVDHSKTKFFRFFAVVLAAAAAGAVFSATGSAAYAGAAAAGAVLVAFVVKPRHRGVTHSFLAAAGFGALAFGVTADMHVAVNAAAAYATHLFADLEFKLV